MKEITAELAQKFIENPESVYLGDYTSIEPDAAAILATYGSELDDIEGLQLNLWEIVNLSVESAEKLAKFRGRLEIGLKTLSFEVARALSAQEEPGVLDFSKLEELKLDAAKELCKHQGSMIVLVWVNDITVDTAEELASYDGHLLLNGITKVDEPVAKALSQTKGWINLNGAYRESSESALKILRDCEYVFLSASEMYGDSDDEEDWDDDED